MTIDAIFPEIINTAALMGVLHTLCSLHHLSALAAILTLSSTKAYTSGMRYICGHCIGISIVAVLNVTLQHSKNVAPIADICFHVIGGVSIFHLAVCSLVHSLTLFEKLELYKLDWRNSVELVKCVQDVDVKSAMTVDEQMEDAELLQKVHQFEGSLWRNRVIDLQQFVIPPQVFLYGLTQGWAGAAGMLGIFPAVILNDRLHSTLYMIIYTIAVICTALALSMLYGICIHHFERGHKSVRGILGMVVGVICLCMGLSWIIYSIRQYREILGYNN